jgi:hypothetical protein
LKQVQQKSMEREMVTRKTLWVKEEAGIKPK